MKLIKEDSYEEMAAAFQCFQIQALYQVLANNGIETDRIKKICEEFTFSFSNAVDQCWIDSEAGKVRPVVAFTKMLEDQDEKKLFVNNDMFLFAEYAFGNIAWFFEENNPSDSPQKFGSIH